MIQSNEELNLLANYLKNRSFLPEHIYIDDMNGFQYEYLQVKNQIKKKKIKKKKKKKKKKIFNL